MKKPFIWSFCLLLLTAVSCTKESATPESIRLISTTINGSALNDGAQNIESDVTIELVFSTTLSATAFGSAFSLQAGSDTPNFNLTYLSQATRVQVTANLQPETTYTLQIADAAIGQDGERLESGFSRTFTTADDGIITSQPPCTSGTAECLQMASLTTDGTANFPFYASFPIYEEMAEWQELTSAIIVVHGINRNADDYFNYMMQTLQAEGFETNTLLLAPAFRTAGEASADEYFWSSTGWREGQQSGSAAKGSSFEVIDQLIAQLADKTHFPVMEKIIVTGHSSGALFTHLFAAANRSETTYQDLSFDYVVANSQYFYYPDGQRINEGTDQLYTPTGCTGYDFWPMGYDIVAPYVGQIGKPTYDDQFVGRSITYLLGNGTGSDSSLNTTDCFATLLGSSRYNRGENMFRYMELAYPSHNHNRVIVDGIGHNGQGMYSSATFKTLVNQLLQE